MIRDRLETLAIIIGIIYCGIVIITALSER
jgi:hypothetical protein